MKRIKIAILMPSGAKKSRIVCEYFHGSDLIKDDFCFEIWTDNDNQADFSAFTEFDVRCIKSNSLDNDDDIAALNEVDILLVCGWGSLVSSQAIEAPKLTALNCHSSYLPDYKGGSVYLYQWANCESYGGATVHYLSEKFDAGNILARQRFKINKHDTAIDILYKASELTGPLAMQAIYLALNNKIGITQHGGRYFKKVRRRRLLFYRFYNKYVRPITGRKWLTPFFKK